MREAKPILIFPQDNAVSITINEVTLRKAYMILGREKMRSFFKEKSIIARWMIEDQGGWKMLEVVYSGKILTGGLNRYLLTSVPAEGLRNRVKAVIRYLEFQIKEIFKDVKRLKIANLGCGSAKDIITVAKNIKNFNPVYLNYLDIDCVDIDQEALQYAEQITKRELRTNLSSIRFINRSLVSCPYHKDVDIVILVGIICGLSHRESVILLKKIKKYLKPGGKLIASNVAPRMLERDPFFSKVVLEEIMGWKLIYKTPKEIRDIFKEAGYNCIDIIFDEPTRFHIIGIGTPFT